MENYTDRVNYFCVGLGIGAVAGLLLAPKPGANTREEIGRKFEEGKQYAEAKVRELRARAEDVVETGKQFPDRVSQAFEAGKQAYQREKQSAG